MDPLKEKIKRRIFGKVYIHPNHDIKNTVFLAGSARSGSTWVSNIINYDNSYRYMFEPFYPQKVKIVNNFKIRQYLRSDNNSPEYLEPIKTIISGDIRNNWIDHHNKSIYSKKRLIKDIRANLLLKNIKSNFPDIPIILLIRHPCAVAASKIKLGWSFDLSVFLEQAYLMEDHLNRFKDYIKTSNSKFEIFVFNWAIQHYVLFRQFNMGEIHICFYEDFCTYPHKEIKRLFEFINLPYTKDVFKQIKTPSAVTLKDSSIVNGKDMLNNWKNSISKDQIARANDILRLFGLDKIYDKNSNPNLKEIYRLMANKNDTK